MTDTSIIQAASAGVKDMADGSLRITFEFSPDDASSAYALFGSRGRNVAITALKDGYSFAKPEPASPTQKKDPIGALCQWCVLRCNELDFWEFLNFKFAEGQPINASEAAEIIKFLIGIESRKELDTNDDARILFDTEIRYPYQKWLITRGK